MTPRLRIVADGNMPLVVDAFRTIGEVVTRDGRAIAPADVADADVLVTRSTTRINAALLAGSRVRFYGSAVIGTDHIDADWLAAAHIPWSGAPGCNAESVAEYVTAALLLLAGRQRRSLAGLTLGVIGVGHVGRRVAAKGAGLGMKVLGCDPPRQRDPADAAAAAFVPLARLLAEADVVSCHVPLTLEGPDATRHLLGAEALALLKPGAWLINAARGEVVSGDALLAARGRLGCVVLDTWEGEPAYRPDVLGVADLATPHIAGHSYEGKVNGTLQVYEAACRALGIRPCFVPQLPPPSVPELQVDAAGRDEQDVLAELVSAVYDIAADDAALRASCVADPAARAREFDRQRRDYPMRREFAATSVTLRNASDRLCAAVRGLGFAVHTAS